MSSNIRTTLYGFSSAFILSVALAGCATYGKAGAGNSADDAKVTANVRALLDQHPEFGSPNAINVQTLDHVVYLNGLVSEGLESREAQSVAQQAPGVARVVNLLAVDR
jgi:osmotically-inducible protein OsmY